MAVRNRWWVLLGTVLGLAAGLAATKLLKPQYRAQATVWIDVGNRQDANRGPIRSGQLLEAYAWVDLLRSYAVLDDVVRQLRLYAAPGSPADTLPLVSFDVAQRFRPGRYRLAVDQSGKSFSLTGEGGVVLQRGATCRCAAAAGDDFLQPRHTARRSTAAVGEPRRPSR
ncbi:MAG: hypothetical protein AUH42_05630 [Gemmatimonadetes bacterium 13_1_40CM_70_11]|nr:MAG: hypothetical protein AUH42_05630 [Gemmatimonadetes bacterium 13_1_40CM_70_11]